MTEPEDVFSMMTKMEDVECDDECGGILSQKCSIVLSGNRDDSTVNEATLLDNEHRPFQHFLPSAENYPELTDVEENYVGEDNIAATSGQKLLLAQFSISNSDRKRALKGQHYHQQTSPRKERKFNSTEEGIYTSSYGDTTTSTENIENSSQPTLRPMRKRKVEIRLNGSNGFPNTTTLSSEFNHNNNNNNTVKSERLSPHTPPETAPRSRSITPSTMPPHVATPPVEQTIFPPMMHKSYSDVIRSLAAKYNNPPAANEYINAVRNGFPPNVLDPRLKHTLFTSVPLLSSTTTSTVNESTSKKPTAPSTSVPNVPSNSFTPPNFLNQQPHIDMSSTQTLLALSRSAKEAEIQLLLKSAITSPNVVPLDLSAGSILQPPRKRPKSATAVSSASMSSVLPGFPGSPACSSKSRPQSATPPSSSASSPSQQQQEDITLWSVDDVCSFVSKIDICAEYSEVFREQRIDGSGLSMLTEDHLTSKMNMKLGPALKLRLIVAKKLGRSCGVCLHCTQCHRSPSASVPSASIGSPDPTSMTIPTTPTGGAGIHSSCDLGGGIS